MQPFVAVSMIKVPVGVDQVLNRIGANTRQCFVNSKSRCGNACVDEKFAVAARQHGDISARALEHTDVTAQLGYIDLRGSGGIANDDDGTFTVGEHSARH
jgi:hypothetical protein